jgi:hypothetical protein
MKTLGLCFVLILLAGSLAISAAQTDQQSDPASLSADQRSTLDSSKPGRMSVRRDALFSSDDDVTCAFMRTYRVKREGHGSDVVRPDGYTTCVPTTRMTLKSTVEIKREAEK